MTTPRAETVEEAVFFAGALAEMGLRVDAVVANRMQPHIDPLPAIAPTPGPLRTAVMRAHAIDARADAHQRVLAPLRAAVAPTTVFAHVPLAPGDVHDLPGLASVAESLCRPPS